MKTLSWALSVVLVLGTIVVLAFGIRQLTTSPAPPAAPAPAPAPAPVVADSVQQRNDVMEVGRATTVRLLSYTPQTAERELTAAAEEVTTAPFQDTFTQLITDVVIPAATSKQITAEAQVPAIAVESLDADSATLIVFIDQKVTTGTEEPTDTQSSVRMALEKVGDDSWLVSAFDPL